MFEGFVDFLSALVLRTVKDEDCLVLNSVSNLVRSYAVLEGYGKSGAFLTVIGRDYRTGDFEHTFRE